MRAFHRIATGPLLHNSRFYCYNPHLMTNHLAQLTIRATRRQFLEKTVLNQNKQVINAEIRTPEDLVLNLKKAGNCPGVILPQSGRREEEVDIVLPGKAMRTRQKSPQYGLEKVHVRAGGREFPCVLRDVRMNRKNFIEKVYLQEYVPGKANRLRVPPVSYTHLTLPTICSV